jgi:hypothetical protein
MHGETVEKGPGAEGGTEAAGKQLSGPPAARKQIYLRSVYSLNPGIPHFVDVPGGW